MAIVERPTRDGTIRFQVKVKDPDGKWYPSRTCDSRREAIREEERLMELKQKGGRALGDDAKVVTVSQYWDVWALENRREVSDGWKISQDQMFRDYVQPVIGNRTLLSVKAPDIGAVLNRAKDRGLGDQTLKHVYSLMRKMFSDAVEYYEMLAANPVKPKFHRPKVSQQERSFLPPDQAWKLLESCRGHYAGPAVWLQTLAGLRIEAAQGLDWRSVFWDQNQILIRRAWKQKIGRLEDFPKTGDWEYVPLVPALKDYLLELWNRDGNPNGFVCRGPAGGMLSYETYLRVLRRLCIAAGVPSVTTHELRHSCTELWIQTGASQEDIRRLLNHRSLTATRRYIHRTDERLSALALTVGKPELRLVSGAAESFPNRFPSGKKEAVCLGGSPVKGRT